MGSAGAVSRSVRRAGVAIAVVCLSALFAAAIRGLSEVTDDAFISFRYARHLVDGVGLVFNPGERVEGYTNFLWTLLMAGGYALGLDPPRFSQRLGCGLAAILVLSLLAYSRRVLGGEKTSPVDALAAILVGTNPLFIHHIGNGLETTLFTLLTLLSFFSWTLSSNPRALGRTGAAWRTGCLLGLSYLTRPDAALWAIAFVTVDLGSALGRRERSARAYRGPLVYGSIFAAIAGAHTVFRLAYYGDLVPNTFYIKVGSNWHWAGVTFELFGPAMTALALGTLIAAPIVLRGRFAIGATGIVAADLLFILRNGGAGGRYEMALLPLVALLFQEIVRAALRRARELSPVGSAAGSAAIAAGVLALAASIFVQQLEPVRASSRFSELGAADDRAAASCLTQMSRPDDTVAVLTAGVLPYYLERPVIDMLGLNDRTIAREGHFDPESPLAHQRYDADYVVRRAPRFIVLSHEEAGIAAARALSDHALFRSRWVRAQLPCMRPRFLVFVDRFDPLRRTSVPPRAG